MNRIDAEYCAYHWLGSSPCEGCDMFRQCSEEETRCVEAIEYGKKYEEFVEKFEKDEF